MTRYNERLIKYGFLHGITFFSVMTAISYFINDNNLYKSLLTGALGGVIVGTLNAFLFNRYSIPKSQLEAISVDLDGFEKIFFQSPAKNISGHDPIIGKLFVTDKRLIFKNYDEDLSENDTSIMLTDIVGQDKIYNFLKIEKGIILDTTSKKRYKFTVDRVDELIGQLRT